MFTSPLASLAGWSWERTVASDLPPALRRTFPPSSPGTITPGPPYAPASRQFAVTGSALAGTTTTLRFPAAGRWHHFQTETGTGTTFVHWIWGRAADLARYPSLRTSLPWGNPLIAIRFEHPFDADGDKGDPKGVEIGTAVNLRDGPVQEQVQVSAITVLACAPGAPGLDSLGVLRHLRDALDAASEAFGDPTWQEFVGAFDGVQQPLRVLEPAGNPAVDLTIELAGYSVPVTLDADHLGDALDALGIGTRAALPPGSRLNVAHGEDVVATASGAPFPDGIVPISPDMSHVSVAPLSMWLAPQQSSVLQRFTRGNTVVPFVDGIATFADLFGELNRAVAAGVQGAFYLTGYALHHDATLGPPGTETTLRTVAEVAEAMATAGGEPRFLALQMLQLDPEWERDAETSVALIGAILALAGDIATFFQDAQSPDQLSFFLYSQAIAFALMGGSASLDSIIDGFEINRVAIDALAGVANVQAYLDPVDADVHDNPHARPDNELVAMVLRAQNRFSVFHQKIQIVRNLEGIHAYCGGIDLNANRTQDRDHASRGPFHDVHARVNGPAAGELATTFSQRWAARSGGTPLALDQTGAFATLPTSGLDVVQVARTYYGPKPDGGPGLEFAPNGETTILETLQRAVARARRYIYIEDQYLTPPPALASALEHAAATVSGPLIIAIPATPDQPFGLMRRQDFIGHMRMAWGDRFKVGLLRKRFSRTQTTFKTARGRLWLTADLGDAPTDDLIELEPLERLPDPPFWLVVDGEAMRAYRNKPDYQSPTSAQFFVERADGTNLFESGKGTTRSSHKAGAAVTTGMFPNIYVHSKIMLIDDAFASIGSANSNRRGYYSDGECNIFALRETLADGEDNWIRDLRVALWSEHLGVTEEYGRVALLDPVACLPLFDRKYTTGNRFTPFDAQPYAVDLDLQTEFIDTTKTLGGGELIGKLAAAMGAAIAGDNSEAIFDTFIDPGSWVE